MHGFLISYFNSPSLALAVGALLFWLFKKYRGTTIQGVFIHDMATNHLPHIYHVLGQIARHLNIEHTEPPPIKFITAKDFKEGED